MEATVYDRSSAKIFWNQLQAVALKSYLLKRRKACKTAIEVLLPVAIMVLIILIRLAVKRSNVDEKSYADDAAKFNPTESANVFKAILDDGGYLIAFTPDSPLVTDVKQRFMSMYPQFTNNYFKTFVSEEDMNDYMTSSRYIKDADNRPLWQAVVFTGSSGNQWNYKIRMNASDAGGSSDNQGIPDTDATIAVDTLTLQYSGAWKTYYFTRGLLFMQHFIDSYILNRTAQIDMTTRNVSLTVEPAPTVAHISDDFAGIVSGLLPFFYTLVYIYPVSQLIQLLVEEKEQRIKETMKMMGLNDFVLWLGWVITYAGMFFITALLITAITNNTVYEYSNKGYILLYFWLFGLSVYAYSYLVSSIFSRARVGSTTGAIVFLLIFFPYFAVSGGSRSQKTAGCLSAPVCFGLGTKVIADLESNEQGVTASSAGTEVDFFSYNDMIGMLIFDIFFYLILGWYLDKVVPQSYGVAQPWYFCFSPSYWRGGSSPSSSAVASDDHELLEVDPKRAANFEAASAELKVGLQARKLVKHFPSEDGNPVIAVKDFSIDMYEDQIFALLGHNGAGKTTSISVLSGMYPPTSGDAKVFGNSIKTNMYRIRQNLGVCPQHSILWDILTVEEHLRIFAKIKGVPSDKIEQSIKDIIAECGLTEKTHVKTGLLSGGQKRKVCVAMALIGGSKVVFLDEPTSGMDPYSRRNMWELLRRAKKGRVIILTTHFMDEADQLGDRIAIMAKGEIQCCGSSLFLKSRYGVGYTLTLNMAHSDAKAGVNVVQNLVQKHTDRAEVLAIAGSEIAFRLPFDASSSFPALFSEIDSRQRELRIEGYSISVTTLEEVFLRVGREEEANERDRVVSKIEKTKDDRKSAVGENFNVRTNEQVSFPQHVRALLLKRWHNAKRDRRVWTWQILYPFVILLVGLGLLKVGDSFAFPSPTVNTSVYNKGLNNPIPFNNNSLASTYPTAALTSSIFPGNSYALAINNVDTPAAMRTWLLNTYKNRAFRETRYGAFVWNSVTPPSQKANVFHDFRLFINTTSREALPIHYNLYSNLVLQQVTGDTTASIQMKIVPFPLTEDQKALNGSLSSIVIAIGLAFIPASVVGWIVKERESKAKKQQELSGMSITAYWISNYIWDVVNFAIPILLAIIVMYIYQVQNLIGENFGAFFLLLIFYAISIPPFTYVASFLFTNHSTAQNVLVMVYILSGAILLIVSVVLDIIPSTRDANKTIKFFFRLIPNFCLGNGIAELQVRKTVIATLGKPKGAFDMEVVGYNLIFMTWEAIFYMGLVFLIEYVLKRPDLLARFVSQPNRVDRPYEEDPDVINERQRLLEGQNDDLIQVKQLRKVFPGRLGDPEAKVAVKNVTFGVHSGEVFGLLGINGAGKTTLMRMLTADETVTSGSARLAGLDIVSQQDETRKQIGYCPQFDALIETMTAYEQLTLYCQLRGVVEEEIPQYVERMIQHLGLSPFATQPCGGYSGGNKRKLSLGMALVGNPKILFLDEPSTGMDPGARRFMWDLISSISRGRSVVLTTHSMEECEALCERLCIMVGGRMRCIGTTTHLKNRYGQGYQLDANTGSQPVKPLSRFIRQNFPGAHVIEKHENSLKYSIPKGNYTLGELFGIFEHRRAELNISEYALSETSLEQVFISFARQQEEETGVVEGLNTKKLNDDDDGDDEKSQQYSIEVPKSPTIKEAL